MYETSMNRGDSQLMPCSPLTSKNNNWQFLIMLHTLYTTVHVSYCHKNDLVSFLAKIPVTILIFYYRMKIHGS